MDQHPERISERIEIDYAPDESYAQLRLERSNDNGNGKGKGRAVSPEEEDGVEDDDENDGLPKTAKVKAFRDKRGKLKKRMRDALITLHKTMFLQGDAHHVLGAGHEEKENEAYEGAEGLRKNILKRTSSLSLILEGEGKVLMRILAGQ